MGVFRRSRNRKPLPNADLDLPHDTIDVAIGTWVSGEAAAVRPAALQGTDQSLPPPLFGDLAPIAGVDIAAYGWVTKRIAAHSYDQNLLVGFAAQRGIAAEAWQEAAAGWAVRMTNPVVASEFRRHYDAS
jgi:hypothetical protein